MAVPGGTNVIQVSPASALPSRLQRWQFVTNISEQTGASYAGSDDQNPPENGGGNDACDCSHGAEFGMGIQDRDVWDERANYMRAKEREPESSFPSVLDTAPNSSRPYVEQNRQVSPGAAVMARRRRRRVQVGWAVTVGVAIVAAVLYYYVRH